MRRGFLIFLGLGLALLFLPGTGGADLVLEELPYRVSLGPWQEIGRANLTLTELSPGRYLAQFTARCQGVWSLLDGWLPDQYQTEMSFRDGRLFPLVFREKVRIRGRRLVKEYRFDYQQGHLEYWRKINDRELVRMWQVPLQEMVFDPLSLFYNLRLGVFGDLGGGGTIRVQGIPTPEPEEMVLAMGERTDQGRKIMLTIREPKGGERGPFFFCTGTGPGWVPQDAWTRIFKIGKLAGHLEDSRGGMPKAWLNPPRQKLSSLGQ
jgi:hypothetical protein